MKRALVGAPMASHAMEETLLRKTLALPIFASDALSSVAYATEAALIVLIGTSLTSAYLILPVSAAVSLLLAIVVLSYRQTVRAYSTSGGSYIVSRENLGTIPSLVAGAALLTDYVLTVAVSVAAGVLAIVSAAPTLQHLKLELAIGAVVLITLVNLRGVRESGVAFALPTYAFIVAFLVLILTGVTRCTLGTCPTAVVPDQLPVGTGAITLFVLLRAFASGSSALTGVEAISNGVSAFRHPQARNAARTLGILAVVAITLFMGVSWLSYRMHALPSGSASVVSQVARATFPGGSTFGFMFWVVQITTFAILVLAANTSFQGFPRLAAMLAHDRFFPRQFGNLGDRLVYSNGIIVLSGLAVFLLWAYDANVDSLIHLYVIGVFTAFTLSQAGMVRYWRRQLGPGWKRSAAVNAVGATATGVVMVIVIVTKFTQGAWIVIVAIPLLVLAFLGVHRHYRRTSRRLRAGAAAMIASTTPSATTLIAVDAIDEATKRAVWYAREIAGSDFRPVHVPGSRHRPCDSPALARVDRRLATTRAHPGTGRKSRVTARVRLERAPAPGRLRQRRRSGALPQAITPRGAPAHHVVPAEAAPAQRARRRDHRRPSRRGRAGCCRASARPRPRLRGPRRLPARHRLRRDARARRRARGLLRLRRRGGAGHSTRLGTLQRASAPSTSSRPRSATSATRCSRTCATSRRTDRSPSW